MKIKLLDGSTETIILKNFVIKEGFSKSNFQSDVRQQIRKMYPLDNIFEEVYIKGERFFLDFFLPNRSIVIECNGRQHYEHVKFFHKTVKDFNKQKDVDDRKRQWCNLNNFKLIEIKYV